MRKITILVTSLLLLFAGVFPAKSADPQGKKKKHIVIDGDEIVIPDIEMKALEKALRKMEVHLEDFEFQMEDWGQHLEALEHLEVVVPEPGEISVVLPDMDELSYNLRKLEHLDMNIDIPPIPPIEIHIPEIDFDFRFDFDDAGTSRLFRELSDDEEIRLQALRSVARDGANTAIPALEKTLQNDPSPALRYQAVRYLARYLDDERTAPLLGNVIENDKNVEVRKKAIKILGKSEDPRAVEILEDVIKG